MANIRIKDQTTDTALVAGDYVIVDNETEGTRKFDLGQKLVDIDDDITDVKSDLEELEGGGLSDGAKIALLACFRHIAFLDDDGDYYQDLYNALYPPADLVSISCVYTQSGTVYDTDTLDSLKSDLVVTAHMSDSTTQTVTTYTLSGTLTEGTSTITVSYGGKTTTFDVTVTHYEIPPLYNWDFTESLVDKVQGAEAVTTGTFTEGTGISYDADGKYTDLGAIYDYDRTYEFTIEALNRSNTNSYRRVWAIYKNATGIGSYGRGLFYSSGKGGLVFYTGAWQTGMLDDGIGTLDARFSIYVDSNGIAEVYRNGVYVGKSTTAIPKGGDYTNVYCGASGNDFTRVLLKSYKVYDGKVIN